MRVTNDKKIKKMCSFYASEFHLEMIILPYIEEKLKEGKTIKIITESNLEESIKVLLSRINIKNKKEILKINWKDNSLENIKDNTVVIINGTERFVEEKNEILEKHEVVINNLKKEAHK